MDTIDPVPFLLVTANVGSVFEDVSTYSIEKNNAEMLYLIRIPIAVIQSVNRADSQRYVCYKHGYMYIYIYNVMYTCCIHNFMPYLIQQYNMLIDFTSTP